MNNIEKAMEFGKTAHKGQLRKYSNAPYFDHCVEVMELVKTVPHTEEMLIAALLHDTVEDTEITFNDIEREFGSRVRDMVEGLTDISVPEDGNRKVRKAKDLEHSVMQSANVQTIKLADLISNSRSILGAAEWNKEAKAFSKLYLQEKKALLEGLLLGDMTLRAQALSYLLAGMRQ